MYGISVSSGAIKFTYQDTNGSAAFVGAATISYGTLYIGDFIEPNPSTSFGYLYAFR
jgi:hypothetical protein